MNSFVHHPYLCRVIFYFFFVCKWRSVRHSIAVFVLDHLIKLACARLLRLLINRLFDFDQGSRKLLLLIQNCFCLLNCNDWSFLVLWQFFYYCLMFTDGKQFVIVIDIWFFEGDLEDTWALRFEVWLLCEVVRSEAKSCRFEIRCLLVWRLAAAREQTLLLACLSGRHLQSFGWGTLQRRLL